MSLLPSIISSKPPQPFLLLQSTAAQSCLPILRSILDKTLVKKPVILVCFLHPPPTLVKPELLQSQNLRLLDWTARVPGYSDYSVDPHAEILKVIQEYGVVVPDVIIDSADTLLSNLGSLSETYRILNSILLALRPSGTTRFIVHILAPNPLIPLLAQVRFSPSLFHLKAHPPVLLTHISKAYLTLPPPQTTPEKFYSVFTPLSERHHECEKLVFGTDGEGSGGSEIVVEMVMRCTGGASRKRGVERYLEGWMSNSATSCDLQQLESLKSLWAKQVAMQDDAPDPTKNLSFNLNLTEEQQHARSQVPLPYAHEGKPASTSTPASILYDPDSADDIDDDDPDEDLDL